MRPHFLKTFLPPCLLITSRMTIPFSVQAAVVVLKNGDRITGRIVKMEKQRLVRYEFMFGGDDVIVFHKQQGFRSGAWVGIPRECGPGDPGEDYPKLACEL